MHHHEVGGLQFGRHVCQLKRRPLEFADGLTKLLAVGRPVQRQLQQSLRATAAAGSNPYPAHFDPLVGKFQAFAFCAEHLTLIDSTVIK